MKTASSKIKRRLAFYLKGAFALLVLSSLISCQTVTVWPEGVQGLRVASAEPDYQRSEPFFFWGLVGESVVPAGEICKGGKPAKLQSQTSFLDRLIPFILSSAGAALGLALAGGGFSDSASDFFMQDGQVIAAGFLGALLGAGIYTPKTAKVWCGREEGKPAGAGNDVKNTEKPVEAI